MAITEDLSKWGS